MPARPAKRRTASKTVSPGLRPGTEQRIVRYATQHHGGKFTRVDVRFRGAYYVDSYRDEPGLPAGYEPPTGETREEFRERLSNTPTNLFRLRHLGGPDR